MAVTVSLATVLAGCSAVSVESRTVDEVSAFKRSSVVDSVERHPSTRLSGTDLVVSLAPTATCTVTVTPVVHRVLRKTGHVDNATPLIAGTVIGVTGLVLGPIVFANADTLATQAYADGSAGNPRPYRAAGIGMTSIGALFAVAVGYDLLRATDSEKDLGLFAGAPTTSEEPCEAPASKLEIHLRTPGGDETQIVNDGVARFSLLELSQDDLGRDALDMELRIADESWPVQVKDEARAALVGALRAERTSRLWREEARDVESCLALLRQAFEQQDTSAAAARATLEQARRPCLVNRNTRTNWTAAAQSVSAALSGNQ